MSTSNLYYFSVYMVILLFFPANKVLSQSEDVNKNVQLLAYPEVNRSAENRALSYDSLLLTGDWKNYSFNAYKNNKKSKIHDLINNTPDGSVIEIPPGEYISELFVLKNRHNLTFKAKPGTVWLISDDPANTIFILADCSHIILQGLGFLHRVEGFCSGNSLDIIGCKNIIIDSCDISGSGTIGIFADFVDSLTIKNSYIHHCTYEIIHFENVRNAIILNNLFQSNSENTTINEGVSVGNIWGKCIIQNNTFKNNACASVVFDIKKQKGSLIPVGNGQIFIKRNFFYNNYSPAKFCSIFDVFSDSDNWGEYAVAAEDYVIFEENVFNTQANTLEADDIYNSEGDVEFLWPERFCGDFDLKNNYFKEINEDDYGIYVEERRIGICPNAVPWISFSRIPLKNE